MQKFIALCLFAALVAAAPQNLNDLTGTYSLWRPPTWPNFETCCYLQGANITLTADVFTLKSLVMGPCAQYLPGTNGLANMQLQGKVSDLASGNVNATVKYFTMAGVHTQDRTYNVVYTVERSPAPVDILTFTMVGDSNCTFELRNDTQLYAPQQKVSTFFQKFLAKLEKVSARLDSFFSRTADDFTGRFSLWRPPTWQNFSQCCYLMGANVTYNAVSKQFNYQAVVMGPCAGLKNLPGTNGTMTAQLTAGTFADSQLTLQAQFFVAGQKQAEKTFQVTTSVELTPAPVDIYVYHNVEDKADTSCDFKLRKDVA